MRGLIYFLVIFFVIIVKSTFSQNNNKLEVLDIDSVFLKYYYIIEVKRESKDYYYTILSKKINPNKINKIPKNVKKIQLGDLLDLKLEAMYMIMTDLEDVDSVYEWEYFKKDIYINDRLFISKDLGVLPRTTENLHGLYYTSEKTK